ncbi:MAG: hypothetical protein CMJ67_09175 [Planctomycetaceae bacterium]|nr:hypothetical protein [Planctomycetaceae bacterium]
MSFSHATGSAPAICRSFLVPILLVMAIQSTAAAGDDQASGSSATADVGDHAAHAPADPPRERRRKGRGPLGDEDMERLIAVADDISPEWASSLRSRLAENPEEARADFRRNGRRLFGLLMLKDSNPELYKVRVAELALKKGIQDQAKQYHAILAKDPVGAERIASNLKELVLQSVDLELRARALELQALDTAVRELRSKLMSEVDESKTKAERVWKQLLEEPASGDQDTGPLDGLRPGSFPGGRLRPGSEQGRSSNANPDDRG